MNNTPGPWQFLDRKDAQHCLVTDAAGKSGIARPIESIHEYNVPYPEEMRANGRMIAAAPELFAACESALAWLCNVNVSDPATVARQLMAAMQKAGYDQATLDEAAAPAQVLALGWSMRR